MNRFVTVIGKTFALYTFITFFSSCTEESNTTLPSQVEEEAIGQSVSDGESTAEGCKSIAGDITVNLAGIPVDLKPNESAYQGDLLILPAWDEKRNAWCTRGRICTKARSKGFRVILPEMGKSVYTQHVYPETRADWKAFPTTQFLIDSLIPALRDEYCLLQEDGYNLVIGISSGARGAIRLIQNLPDLFAGAVALSGDYDPSQMIGDNIYRGFLGRHADHPERWAVSENLLTSSAGMKTPLYLGHGRKDDLVPYTQTEHFYNSLRKNVPSLHVKLHLPSDRTNGFAYWNTEMNNIFRFFESIQAGNPESP